MRLQTQGLVPSKILDMLALVLREAMIMKEFPNVVVTDDLKLAVIVEVLMVVILVIQEAPEVVTKGVEVEKDNEIVVEEEALMLAVKVEVEVEEILDRDPKVL